MMNIWKIIFMPSLLWWALVLAKNCTPPSWYVNSSQSQYGNLVGIGEGKNHDES